VDDYLLPPFPVDDATLDMLAAALDPRGHGDEHATRSCVGEFLTMMSQLGGSDTRILGEVDGIQAITGACYSEHDVIAALVGEVRRLRA
jgi:hypothetical protein